MALDDSATGEPEQSRHLATERAERTRGEPQPFRTQARCRNEAAGIPNDEGRWMLVSHFSLADVGDQPEGAATMRA